MKTRAHSHREARPQEVAPGNWQILLGETPAKTPAGNSLMLPSESLAGAVAKEWRSRADAMRSEGIGLIRLANTAIDLVSANREVAVKEMLNFAAGDLLCFRAPAPPTLVERQSALWAPLLEWAEARYGIHFAVRFTITAVVPRADDFAGLKSFLAKLDPFALAGLVAAANILGSAVLALALFEERIDVRQAFEAAELDSKYQSEIWGEAPEVASLNSKKLTDLSVIAQFLGLARAV